MKYIVKQNFWWHEDNDGKKHLNIGTYFMIIGLLMFIVGIFDTLTK